MIEPGPEPDLFSSLEVLAPKLEEATQQTNKTIEDFIARLNAIGLNLESWVELDPWHSLGYAKSKNSWTLFVTGRGVKVESCGTKVALQSCNRAIRFAAIAKLPELVKQIQADCERLLA